MSDVGNIDKSVIYTSFKLLGFYENISFTQIKTVTEIIQVTMLIPNDVNIMVRVRALVT